MEVRAVSKFVSLSPRKAADLVRALRGLRVPQALLIAENLERKAAFQIGKTLKSAIANAENNAGLSAEDLFVKDVEVNQGPTHRRWWFGPRGMPRPIRRKTSHIKVVLSEKI